MLRKNMEKESKCSVCKSSKFKNEKLLVTMIIGGFIVILMMFLLVKSVSSQELTIYTDKDTYLPGENVTVNANYTGNKTNITFKINYPNGTEMLNKTIPINNQIIGDESIIAHWTFDEGESDVLHDLTDNNNNGTIYGEPIWTTGRKNYAIQFDDKDDMIIIPDDNSLELTDDFSIEFWIYPTYDSINHRHRIINKHQASVDNEYTWHIYIEGSTGKVALEHSPGFRKIVSNSALQAKTWAHIVITYNDTSNTGKIYFNGNLDVEKVVDLDIRNNPRDVYIGHQPGDNTYFDGILDEIRIYSRCLNSSEVLDHYWKLDLTAHWTFDEGEGDVLHDLSDNNNNGTIYGEPIWTTGKKNFALQFDDKDDMIIIPDDNSLELTEDFSFEFCIFPIFDSTDHRHRIINKHQASVDNEYTWHIYAEGASSKVALEHSPGFRKIVSNSALQTKTWTHIVITYNDTSNTGKIYFNGDIDKETVVDLHIRNNPRDVYIGHQPGGNTYFDGILDEIRIYSRCLNSLEVLDHYNNKFDRHNISFTFTLPNDAPNGTYTVRAATDDNITAETTFEVIIGNHKPTVNNVKIIPTEPKTNDDLSVSYDYFDEDNDTELGTTFRWYKDIGDGFVYANINTPIVSSDITLKGEIWKCEVTPKDGEEFGTPVNSTEVIIINTPPTIANVTVTPSNPFTKEVLSVGYDFYDINKDDESGTTYKWYKDTGNGFTETQITTKIVAKENTKKHEKWRCEVTPKDGEDFGDTVESSVIEILNSKPTAVITSPKKDAIYYIGDEIQFDASDSTDDDNDVLSFKWTEAGVIGSDAKFTLTLIEGTHTITLFVDDKDGGTDSTTVTITVKKQEVVKKPDLTISISDILITGKLKVNETLEISITINNIGEAQGTATIKIYDGEPTSENLITSFNITIAGGKTFTDTAKWTPTAKGNHTLYVVIENCKPTESKTDNNQASISIEIEGDEDGGFIPAPGGGATGVAIGAGALVACFLGRRRRNIGRNNNKN